MVYKKDSNMVVSKELKKALNNLGKKGDTYEAIIWSLIVANNSCSCDESGVGPHVSKGKRSEL